MFGTYNRLNVTVNASGRDVVRAARGKLNPTYWHDASKRDARKAFYRTMLEYHQSAQKIVREWRL